MPESPVWLAEREERLENNSPSKIVHDKTMIVSPTNQNGQFETIADPDESESPENVVPFGITSRSYTHIDDSMPDASDDKKKSPTCRMKSLLMRSPKTFCNKCVSQNSSFCNKFTHFLLQASICYRQMMIAFLLTVMQNFCGNSIILNFAPAIFAQVGFESSIADLVITIILGLVKFFVTCFVIWKIDHFGRRPLLLFGMGIILLSLIMLFSAYETINDDGLMSWWGKGMAILGVFGVAAGYGASFGPLVWVVVSELFPSNVRGRALGISNIFSFLSATLVSYTFFSWQNMMGESAPFAIYGVLTALSMVLIYAGMPETGGKDFEQIGEEMDQMPFWNMSQRRKSMAGLAPVNSNSILV